MITKRPALIARVSGNADVIACVNFARENGLPLSVRGGGHNVAGTALCDGGLMIDMSLRRGVRVGPTRRIVRVEGGATWGDVDHETQPFGLVVPSGIVSNTGVGGFTMGGGFGWTSRKSGYAIASPAIRKIPLGSGPCGGGRRQLRGRHVIRVQGEPARPASAVRHGDLSNGGGARGHAAVPTNHRCCAG